MEDSAARSLFSPSRIRSQVQRDQKDNEPAANAETPGPHDALPEKDDPLPEPEQPYKAHARHVNKPEMTIFFVTKGFSYEGYSFANCEWVRLVPGEKPGSGPVLHLRFNGSIVTDVMIEGRHLRSLCNRIGRHLVPWVWEHPSPAEFTDTKATLISRITINKSEK
jgi:hypothetical protein